MLRKINLKPNMMKSRIQTLLNKTQFFKIIISSKNSIQYTLENPSQVLIGNIYVNWLRYLHLKTHKFMPTYIQKVPEKTKVQSLPFGIICHNELDFRNKTMEYDFESYARKSDLEVKLIIPQQDTMKYFIQWQRYRKYWWSSITTTPSLFAIGDIKQGNKESSAEIIAKLPCGAHTVECIKIKNYESEFKESACLTCAMSLEQALFILLLDGSNDPKDKYLRLHRKIAPYKMSFALDFKDLKHKESLKDLSALLYHRLNLENISATLPDFSINSNDQINENLHMGIPYTAILNDTTLENGILHLMNSSTKLKEQVHVADFHTYAALICCDK